MALQLATDSLDDLRRGVWHEGFGVGRLAECSYVARHADNTWRLKYDGRKLRGITEVCGGGFAWGRARWGW